MTFKELFDLLDWKSLVAFLQQPIVIVLASIFLAFSMFFFIWMIYTLIRGRRQSRSHHEEVGLLAEETSETSKRDMGRDHAGYLDKKTDDDRSEENSDASKGNIMGKLRARFLNKKEEKGIRGRDNNTEEVEELLATIKQTSSTGNGDSFRENVIDNLTTCRLRPYIKYKPERLILTVAVKQADIALKSKVENLSWRISMTMRPGKKHKFTVQPNSTLTPIFKQATFDVLEIYKEMLPELSLRYRLYGSDTEGGTQRLAGEVTVELGELLTAKDYLIDDWRNLIVHNTEYKRRKEKFIKKKITFKE